MRYFNLYDAPNGNVVAKVDVADLRLLEWGEQVTLIDGEQISKFFAPDDSFLFAPYDGVMRCGLVGWSQKTNNSVFDIMSTQGVTDFTFYLSNGNGIRIYNLSNNGYVSTLIMNGVSYNLPNVIDGEGAYYVLIDDGNSIGQLFFKYSYDPSDPLSYDGFKINRVKASDLYTDLLTEWLTGAEIMTDPYSEGGNSTTGGGGGTFDITGDPIPIPSLPSLSACDTGFISLYNPTISELRGLASYMWTGAFDVANFKKLFADPMDAILGLSIVPFGVTAIGQRELKVGNVGTGIQMSYIDDQWAEVDCGTLTLPEFWGAYLDYSPYTKLELYLPYVGTHAVDADEIIGRPVNIVYHIDMMSGSCNAFIKVGDSVLYTFSGQCAVSLPITSTDWSRVLSDAIGIATQMAGSVATGGINAPMTVAGLADTAFNSAKKPSVSKSGSVSGTSGYLAIQRPYFTITRPRQALPRGQNAYIGYPSFVTKQIGECTGYNEIYAIHIEGVPATGAELSEIENLLKGGVIL